MGNGTASPDMKDKRLRPAIMMMHRANRPNLRALQTFEAVSRHRSVSLAGDELGITQSAVSHQLRQLSESLGEKLLVRQGRGVTLTPAGVRLAERLQTAFSDIERSVSETIGGNRDVIRLAVCSAFAPGWLIPRMDRLYAAMPNFDLQLRMHDRASELSDTVADAFITARPKETGFLSTFILPEQLVAVCHESVRPRYGLDLPLISRDMSPQHRGQDWVRFLAACDSGLSEALGHRWLYATHHIIALEMARAGLGAALVPDFLVARDLAAGRLQRLHKGHFATQDGYYFSFKESRRHEPGLETLAGWLQAEIGQQGALAASS